jgi:FkbM family methyltransferase
VSLKRKIYGLPLLRPYRAFRAAQRSKRAIPTVYGFNFAGAHIFLESTWEPHERRLIEARLPLVDVFVDIGANQGFYSCLAAKAGKQVVAIEPDAGNLRYLRANAAANGFDFEIHPVAVSDTSGTATLHGGNDTASLVKGWLEVSSYYKQTVPVETLDNLFADRWAGERLLIKIDVEGAENAVLGGAGDLIALGPNASWLIEAFPTWGRGEEFTELFRLMWGAGYRAQMADEHMTEVSPEMVKMWVDGSNFAASNFFFTHRDQRP